MSTLSDRLRQLADDTPSAAPQPSRSSKANPAAADSFSTPVFDLDEEQDTPAPSDTPKPVKSPPTRSKSRPKSRSGQPAAGSARPKPSPSLEPEIDPTQPAPRRAKSSKPVNRPRPRADESEATDSAPSEPSRKTQKIREAKAGVESSPAPEAASSLPTRPPAAAKSKTKAKTKSNARPGSAARSPAGTGRPSASRSPPRSPRRPGKSSDHHKLKEIAVPILITFGVLLMWPFTWAVLTLSGVLESDRDGATTMAQAMLVSGPVGLALLAGAAYYIYQLRQAKRDVS